jgi:hypothetical protein
MKMKAIFVTSLVCVVISLVALFCVSAITVMPTSRTEHFRGLTLLLVSAFLLVWASLSYWAWIRSRASSRPLPPQWFRKSLIFAGVAYVLAILILAVG